MLTAPQGTLASRDHDPKTLDSFSADALRMPVGSDSHIEPAALLLLTRTDWNGDGCRKPPTGSDKNASSILRPEVFSLEQWPVTFGLQAVGELVPPLWLPDSREPMWWECNLSVSDYPPPDGACTHFGTPILSASLSPHCHQHLLTRDGAIYEMQQMQKNEDSLL